ncbi:5841_t:CDS:2 [Gigaspora rosea]|nr:5841_t:CDS:2 [Gigaspora rosea]
MPIRRDEVRKDDKKGSLYDDRELMSTVENQEQNYLHRFDSEISKAKRNRVVFEFKNKGSNDIYNISNLKACQSLYSLSSQYESTYSQLGLQPLYATSLSSSFKRKNILRIPQDLMLNHVRNTVYASLHPADLMWNDEK